MAWRAFRPTSSSSSSLGSSPVLNAWLVGGADALRLGVQLFWRLKLGFLGWLAVGSSTAGRRAWHGFLLEQALLVRRAVCNSPGMGRDGSAIFRCLPGSVCDACVQRRGAQTLGLTVLCKPGPAPWRGSEAAVW